MCTLFEDSNLRFLSHYNNCYVLLREKSNLQSYCEFNTQSIRLSLFRYFEYDVFFENYGTDGR